MDTTIGQKLIKVYLFSGIFDAPAKSMFLNMTQFNGEYGCSYCLEPGETFKISVRGHTHIYPFNFDYTDGHTSLRTHKETLEHANDAQLKLMESGKENKKFGIKGMTWVMALPKFNIIDEVGIDYMHNTLLGIVKMLMKLWFEKGHKNQLWYIGDRIKEIDKSIAGLKFPNTVSRAPRNIEQDVCHWKASEYRTFLLYYSVPVLHQILPGEYFNHYTLLVEAIYLLLKESISKIDIKKSRSFLIQFCLKIGRLYGQRYQTYNLHNLLHLTRSVDLLGPLWAQSAFWYEDYNGDYKHLFHGTQHVNLQIVSNVIIQQRIPEIARNLKPDAVEYNLYKKMTLKFHNQVANLGDFISPGINTVGKHISFCNIDEKEKKFVSYYLSVTISKLLIFKRICFHGIIIHSQAYKKVYKRNSCAVRFEGRFGLSYGIIKYFLKVQPACVSQSCDESCACKKFFYVAVMNVPEKENIDFNSDVNSGVTLSHIIPVTTSSTTDACHISQIKAICSFIEVKKKSYFVCFPNRIEKD